MEYLSYNKSLERTKNIILPVLWTFVAAFLYPEWLEMNRTADEKKTQLYHNLTELDIQVMNNYRNTKNDPSRYRIMNYLNHISEHGRRLNNAVILKTSDLREYPALMKIRTLLECPVGRSAYVNTASMTIFVVSFIPSFQISSVIESIISSREQSDIFSFADYLTVVVVSILVSMFMISNLEELLLHRSINNFMKEIEDLD